MKCWIDIDKDGYYVLFSYPPVLPSPQGIHIIHVSLLLLLLQQVLIGHVAAADGIFHGRAGVVVTATALLKRCQPWSTKV